MKVIKTPLMRTTLTLHGLDSSTTDPRDLIFHSVRSNRRTHTNSLPSLRSYVFPPKSHPANQFFFRAAFCLLFCPPSSYLLSAKASSVYIQTGQSFLPSSKSPGTFVSLIEAEYAPISAGPAARSLPLHQKCLIIWSM